MNGLAFFIPALLFALLAAIGNALFVYSQKRAEFPQNPLLLLGFAALICAVLLIGSTLFREWPQVPAYVRAHGVWVLATGIGLTITFVGFHFLFTRYGASYYSLYAMLAILTTSVGVGFLAYREQLNGYIVASTLAAVAAIVLLGIGAATKA